MTFLLADVDVENRVLYVNFVHGLIAIDNCFHLIWTIPQI